MRAVLITLTLLALAGCAKVYTWQWSEANPLTQDLKYDWVACVREANSHYTPIVAGLGPKATLAKDCMEKRGYVKVDKGVVPQAGYNVGQTEIHVR